MSIGNYHDLVVHIYYMVVRSFLDLWPLYHLYWFDLLKSAFVVSTVFAWPHVVMPSYQYVFVLGEFVHLLIPAIKILFLHFPYLQDTFQWPLAYFHCCVCGDTEQGANILCLITEVKQSWAWLIHGWVTILLALLYSVKHD